MAFGSGSFTLYHICKIIDILRNVRGHNGSTGVFPLNQRAPVYEKGMSV